MFQDFEYIRAYIDDFLVFTTSYYIYHLTNLEQVSMKI